MAGKRPPTGKPEKVVVDEINERFSRLRALVPELSKPRRTKFLSQLEALVGTTIDLWNEADPIRDPGPPFDPSSPETIGRLVTLALLAQERIPLGQIARSYGSGVYALYYLGDHPLYSPLAGSETPIYVGKADPKVGAVTSRQQGVSLFGRLSDHRRMIEQVGAHAEREGLPHPLRVADFECRRLVCATNAQLVAERHLIGTFRPAWNSEVGIAFGISKHGDDADTRKNGRSPWDTLHPGRAWATKLESDQIPLAEIQRKLADHFQVVSPHRELGDVIEGILAAFRQTAPRAAPEVAALEDDLQQDLEGFASEGE